MIRRSSCFRRSRVWPMRLTMRANCRIAWWNMLTDAGFFRMMLDRKLGGLETDPLTAAQVVETLSKVSPSVGWVVMIVASTNFWAARTLPDEGIKDVFTPGASANVTGNLVPHGRAVKADGGWRVSGQWPLGSGCHHAHWAASGAWLHDEQGPIIENDAPAWRVFYTPIGDCRILDTWHSTGLRGTGSHDYTMDDVFVPERLVTRTRCARRAFGRAVTTHTARL